MGSRKEGEQFQKKWVRVEAMALVRALEIVKQLFEKLHDPDLGGAWVAQSYLQSEAGKAVARNCFGEPIFDVSGRQVGIRRPDPHEMGIEGIEDFSLGLDQIEHEDSWAESVNPLSSGYSPTRIDYVDDEGYKDWEIVRMYNFTFNDKQNLPMVCAVISLGKKEKGDEWEGVFEHISKYSKYPINNRDTQLLGRAIGSDPKLRLHYWKAEKKG